MELNLENLSIRELLSIRDKVDGALRKRKDAEKGDILEKIKALATKAGYSVEELMGSPPPAKTKAAKSVKADAKPVKTRAKVAPKYRNPDDGMTWTGRGRKPKWVEAAVLAGKSLEDLTIR